MTQTHDLDPALSDLEALRTAHTALAGMDPDARRRALTWLCGSFEFAPDFDSGTAVNPGWSP
jgi:hypothetical protein